MHDRLDRLATCCFLLGVGTLCALLFYGLASIVVGPSLPGYALAWGVA